MTTIVQEQKKGPYLIRCFWQGEITIDIRESLELEYFYYKVPKQILINGWLQKKKNVQTGINKKNPCFNKATQAKLWVKEMLFRFEIVTLFPARKSAYMNNIWRISKLFLTGFQRRLAYVNSFSFSIDPIMLVCVINVNSLAFRAYPLLRFLVCYAGFTF